MTSRRRSWKRWRKARAYVKKRPFKVFSPSQFAMADECWRHWLKRYRCGEKDREVQSKGKTTGSVIHVCLDAHATPGGNLLRPNLAKLDKEFDAFKRDYAAFLKESVAKYRDYSEEQLTKKADEALQDIITKAPGFALACTAHLPAKNKATLKPEHRMKFDVQRWRPGARWKMSRRSAIDLIATFHDGRVVLYDYKSTTGKDRVGGGGRDLWAYVPLAEELEYNVQLLIYAAYALDVTGKDEIECVWIYTSTFNKPQAKPICVTVTRAQVAERLVKWFDLADRMVAAIDAPAPTDINLEPLPDKHFPDPSGPCKKYEGCRHHTSRGGTCITPDVPLSALARTGRKLTLSQEGKTKMGLFDRVKELPNSKAFRPPEAMKVAEGKMAQPEVTPPAKAADAPAGRVLLRVRPPTPVTDTQKVVSAEDDAYAEAASEPTPAKKLVAPPAPRPPSRSGRPRRSSNDTDESYALRMAEWEKSKQPALEAEGEEVAEKEGVASPTQVEEGEVVYVATEREADEDAFAEDGERAARVEDRSDAVLDFFKTVENVKAQGELLGYTVKVTL